MTAASLACYVVAAGLNGVPLAADAVLHGADERIRQHRQGLVPLRVLDGAGQPVPAGTKVRIEQTRHAFLFGCNIFALGKCGTPEQNAAYEKHFADLFNFATLPFYWWAYEPEPGKTKEADILRVLNWCKQHGITAKGHPLAWNFYDPAWLPEDPVKAMDLQVKRIGECVSRFKGDIDIWDVVNEAVHYTRDKNLTQSPKLTAAIERMGMRPFLQTSFRMARSANPKATLLINDYVIEASYANKVLDLLMDSEGRPLFDVVGIQSHQHRRAYSVQQLWEACERFAVYGKPLHWTENTFLSGEHGFNVTETRPSFDWTSTSEGEKEQAELAAQFYTVLFSHPAVQAITWWDFADQNAWLGAPAGLLRRDYTPKPAYEALHKLIKGKWWTRCEAVVQADGAVEVRGFMGDYRLIYRDGGSERTANFSIPGSKSDRMTLRCR